VSIATKGKNRSIPQAALVELVSKQVDERITKFEAKYEKLTRAHTGKDVMDSEASIGNKTGKGILETPPYVPSIESHNRVVITGEDDEHMKEKHHNNLNQSGSIPNSDHSRKEIGLGIS